MKNLKSFIASLLLIASCQYQNIKIPKGEQCIVLDCVFDDSGVPVGACPKCWCIDNTFDEGDDHREYEVPCKTYQAISVERYDELENFYEDQFKECSELKYKYGDKTPR